ncbi:MAG: hypothetical protein ACT4TC_14735 [Myxococcaceae bacterium]
MPPSRASLFVDGLPGCRCSWREDSYFVESAFWAAAESLLPWLVENAGFLRHRRPTAFVEGGGDWYDVEDAVRAFILRLESPPTRWGDQICAERTDLGTIVLVSGDWRRELPRWDPVKEDQTLLYGLIRGFGNFVGSEAKRTSARNRHETAASSGGAEGERGLGILALLEDRSAPQAGRVAELLEELRALADFAAALAPEDRALWTALCAANGWRTSKEGPADQKELARQLEMQDYQLTRRKGRLVQSAQKVAPDASTEAAFEAICCFLCNRGRTEAPHPHGVRA